MDAEDSYFISGNYFIGLRSEDEKHDVYPLFKFETVRPLMEEYKGWREFASMLHMQDDLVVGKFVGRGKFENLTKEISQFVVIDESNVLEEKYLNEK